MEMVPISIARPPWAPHMHLNQETKQGVILLPRVRETPDTRVSLSTIMACG